MGLSAPLLKEIADFARDAASAPPSPEDMAKAAKERWLCFVEDLANRGRRLKDRTESLRERLVRFVDALTLNSRGVDLDEVIDMLRATEQGIKTDQEPLVKELKALSGGTFSMRGATPGERARAISVVDNFVSALTDSLEMMRDFRWKIITLRADQEDPGDAPVFEDHEKLVEYLKVHSG